jgi:hypothetical protein
MKTKIVWLAILGVGTAVALGDSWSFPKKVDRKVHEFGESRIVLQTDSTQNQSYPDFDLSVYLGDELVAKYGQVGFGQIFASKDNQYFVGLSNRGLPGTAFVIFDKKGRLIREEKHRFLDLRMYSTISVTLDRVWYDAKNPGVTFEVNKGRLDKVWVNGSKGGRLNLLDRHFGTREYRERLDGAAPAGKNR